MNSSWCVWHANGLLLFVSSQDSWVSCSDTCLLHFDIPDVHHNSDTEHRCFSTALRDSNSSQWIWGSNIWSAVGGYKWKWSTCFSSYHICPHVFLVGHFGMHWRATSLGCIFLCLCLLVFEAFFCMGRCSKLSEVIRCGKRPFCNSQVVSKLLLASIRMSFWHWLLTFKAHGGLWQESMDLESTLTSELNFSASEFYVVLSHTRKVEDKSVQNTALIA